MTDSTDTKDVGEEVKKENIDVTKEKPAEETKEDTQMTSNEKSPVENSTIEAKEKAKPPEEATEAKEEATEEGKDDTKKEDAASSENGTEPKPKDAAETDDKNEASNGPVKKEEEVEGNPPTPQAEASAEQKAPDAPEVKKQDPPAPEVKKQDPVVPEVKKEDPVVPEVKKENLAVPEVKKENPVAPTTPAVDSMVLEPKSELVAAAEEDAAKNKDQPAPCDSAVRPNNRDVLFGRGKPFQNHPGNRKMLQYIDQYKRQYNESPRDQKRPIVEEIIGILTSGGGRFLRRYNEDVNSTWWTEVPKQVAFDKVSHAFRSRGRPKASDSAAAKASLAQARAAAAAVAHQGHPHQQLPHHPQHPSAYAAHHQGQYGGVPPPGAQFGGQFGQYGMPPGNFNPMIAAMQQQHHHNPMMGYHPMPGGITPQQQAMMQAGMMVAMQQQQQQHVGGPPGAPPPPYYQQPPNPYYAQQSQQHQQPTVPQPPQHPPQQPEAPQGQAQQHQPPPAPGQAPAPGFHSALYGGMNPVVGGFATQQQQPGPAPGFATGAPPPGATPAASPVAAQGEEAKG